ncbi:MAG: hypothetical protein AAF849_24020 [Bacteroidota bacterium]
MIYIALDNTKRTKSIRKVFLFLILCVLFHACQLFNPQPEEELLAEVFGRKLYLSEIQDFIPDSSPKEDSILLVESYIKRWTKEAVMLHQAELAKPKDLDVEALVEDYRSSLIRHHYEENIIENELDTTVLEEELRAFYERNKAQYELETPIARAYIIKLARSIEKPSNFNQWWESFEQDTSSFRQLSEFTSTYATVSLLEDSTWYSLEFLDNLLPEGSLTESNIRTKRDFSQRDDDFEYLYRNLDVINKTGIAPFSYIEDQAKRFILQQRKQELLQRKRDEAYQKELEEGNVKIY